MGDTSCGARGAAGPGLASSNGSGERDHERARCGRPRFGTPNGSGEHDRERPRGRCSCATYRRITARGGHSAFVSRSASKPARICRLLGQSEKPRQLKGVGPLTNMLVDELLWLSSFAMHLWRRRKVYKFVQVCFRGAGMARGTPSMCPLVAPLALGPGPASRTSGAGIRLLPRLPPACLPPADPRDATSPADPRAATPPAVVPPHSCRPARRRGTCQVSQPRQRASRPPAASAPTC